MASCQQLAAQIRHMENLARQIHDPQLQQEIYDLIAELRQREQDQGCLGPNIIVGGIEATQAIQFWNVPAGQGSGLGANNGLPLVSERETTLRAYVGAGTGGGVPQTVDGVVSVTGFSSALGLGTSLDLHAAPRPITVKELAAVQRSSLADTLNFTIPNIVAQGSLHCVLKVFDPTNPNSVVLATTDLSFRLVPRLPIHAVLVHYTGVDFFDHPVNAQPAPIEIYTTIDLLFRTYPIPGYDINGFQVLPWSAKLAVTQNFHDLMGAVKNLRAMSGSSDVYMGLIPPAAGCGGVCGLGGGGSAITFAGALEGACHEIGHALGRAHTQCATTAPDADPNYPTYDGFPQGSIGECGFDSLGPGTAKTFDPRSTFDFMSYCRPVWVSPYTYLNLMNAIPTTTAARVASTALEPSSVWTHPAMEFLHAHLRIHRDPSAGVNVRSAFHVRGAPGGTPTPLPTSVTVETVNAQGTAIGAYSCDPLDPHHDDRDPYEDVFATVPMLPEVRGIRVLRAGEVLQTLNLAAEKPDVTLVEGPEGIATGPVRLRWRAEVNERFASALRFHLRYSNDAGETWRGVATRLTGNEYNVEWDFLPGGTRCKLQVIASAGLRSGVAETSEFQVLTKPRKAYITTPGTRREYWYGEVVGLIGGGFSPDYGTSPAADTVWFAHTTGKLGTGHRLAVADLPVGVHFVTVHVPDGQGGDATETRQIVIKAAPDHETGERHGMV